ncbi:DUF4129 domain-containing protein [Brachybacterium sp. GCM10030252]|uniref:DUF4129 domain-containing protein n=1 Tax=Brachybacterium sp. GCM10030252 TaxID=3273380 RepID=UPI0036195B26
MSRRVVALLLLVAALGGVGLATLGAAADRGSGPTFVGRTQPEFEPPLREREPSQPDLPSLSEPAAPPQSDGSSTGIAITLWVLGALVAALAVWLLLRMRKLARPTPAVAADADEDELTAAQAQAAFEDARAQLSTVVDAHDAVIAAWLALERAIAEAGVRRSPSQTTLEFVVAVLGTLELDRSSLDRLSQLYRRALFDPTPLAESDRDEALTLLDRLTADLDAPTERRSP